MHNTIPQIKFPRQHGSPQKERNFNNSGLSAVCVRLYGLILLMILTPTVRAQFTVSDFDLENASTDTVAEKAIEIGEKGQSLDTQLGIFNLAEKTYGTNLSTLDATIKIYDFQQTMDAAPTNDYSGYQNNGVVMWTPVASANNTYGNSQQWIEAASTALGSASAVQSASVSSPSLLSGYDALSSDGQQAIAAVGSTIELEDAATATSLRALGTARMDETQRELDISALEQSTHSLAPSEQTLMSELHRMNQALILRLRGEEDEMELQQAQDTHRLLHRKARLDALKTAMAAATEFEQNYATYQTGNVLNLTGSSSH